MVNHQLPMQLEYVQISFQIDGEGCNLPYIEEEHLIISFKLIFSIEFKMGMCQTCDRSKFQRTLDPNNMPVSAVNKLSDDMFKRGQQPAQGGHGSHHLHQQGGGKAPREIMEYKANLKDDFITHHLKHQLSLTSYVSTKRITNRQIAEHILLQTEWGSVTGLQDPDLRIVAYFETFVYTWIQQTFLDIWKIAHEELFVKEHEAKPVRRKIAQQFMFELYELKEFVDSGMANACFKTQKTKCNLFDIMQYTDDALLNVFKELKNKYPQTAQTDIKDLPDFPNWPIDGIKLDLFKHFPSKSFSDPLKFNYQTTYSDISFLLNTAIELQETFKNDMKELLGADATGCVKVSLVEKDGQKQFNACAVRRIFVKWTQNLLQNCPELYNSRAFLNFIKAKSEIISNFYFKSTVQPTTHKIVIQTLSDLLQAAKYSMRGNKPRPQFIFNIYDLLRCKIKRNSVAQVVGLLQKMKTTKKCHSGKPIEIVRIKNRFQTGNRDFLVNFKYGDIIIGEAQLCLDDAHVSKQAKSNHQFCHFIYQLERSIFGPTLELMMQYEDTQRPDISVKFQAEGEVKPRESQEIKSLQKTERICMNGHPMVSLLGNFFSQRGQDETAQDVENRQISVVCSYCGGYSTTGIQYDYCFKCGIVLCQACKPIYHNFKPQSYWLSIQNPVQFRKIQIQSDLKDYCAKVKAPIVLFWLQGSSPSEIMKNSILMQYIKSSSLPNYVKPIIAFANVKQPNVKALCKANNITEYPTLVLFDQSIKPIRKIIAFQWYQVPMVYKTQKQILEGGSPAVQLICSIDQCGKPITIVDKSTISQEVICMMCFNQNNPKDLPQQYQSLVGVCEVGHYRCNGCSYAAIPGPSSYKDCFGSYLSSSFDPKLGRCPKGHLFQHIKENKFNSWIYECSTCKNKRIFDEENGVGYCRDCNIAECTICLGYKSQNLEECQKSSDLAFHFVGSTAEESYRCVCGQLFKKVYTGCFTNIQDYLVLDQNGITNRWKCMLCQYQAPNGQLHLSCFACPMISKVNNQNRKENEPEKLYNLQICLPCAKRANILQRQVKAKVKQEKTHYKCPKSQHQIVSTSESFGQITFDCYYCRKTYFAHTERFYCTGCRASFCQVDRQCKMALIKGFLPKIQHSCPNDHPLVLEFVAENAFQFCDGCMHIIKDAAYSCRKDGSPYSLCQSCIDNNPSYYKGTILQDIKDISLSERAVLVKNGVVDALGIAAEVQQIGKNLGQLKDAAGQLWDELWA